MCGIVGYVGDKEAASFLLEGLAKLEYRGYDSAGIAVFDGAKIGVEKSVGRLAALRDKLKGHELKGTMGIGHTRWATHGRPSDKNSYPNTDCSGDFVVVHNGIIENYLSLKEELIEKGHNFKSETDTEVVAHLIEEVYNGDFVASVREVLRRVEGSYSLVFMSSKHPGTLIATKQDNPLVIGVGEGENFIASDIPAIIQRTRRTYILNDGELAVITKDSIKISNRQGEPVTKKIFEVNWNAEAAEKRRATMEANQQRQAEAQRRLDAKNEVASARESFNAWATKRQRDVYIKVKNQSMDNVAKLGGTVLNFSGGKITYENKFGRTETIDVGNAAERIFEQERRDRAMRDAISAFGG